MKVAKLEGCEFRIQSTRLNYQYSSISAAITVKDGREALICFESGSYNRCEVYNGRSSKSTFKTKFSHWGGKLGVYKDKPTTVGSYCGHGKNSVETLQSSGWSTLAEFPRRYLKQTWTQ